ncbi:hypothetical protein HanXRQr2_Chr14g0635251 [Helianthus annuus]|uniref:Uncharacterized protein n=1 Tax=Helianthus annuus TaxID=4232 RepID=A0A251SG48_HELAN|nr:hypothetical protein HanXRQr2_Chr14g0635251 [Helianthus annuus]KAJ0839635.1 hypothetical protein HanPSC8_Chr14g0609211 [Helianthus annuus]
MCYFVVQVDMNMNNNFLFQKFLFVGVLIDVEALHFSSQRSLLQSILLAIVVYED